jgi:hypothetical protein
MSRAALNSRLSDPGFAPQDIKPAADEARAWFVHTADPAAFTVLGVLCDLIARGFDGQQGVPTAEWQRVATDALPRLRGITTSPPTATQADLVIAYHSTL